MFWIRYQKRNEANQLVTVEEQLMAPTAVDYPERRDVAVRTTVDGAVVIQRPMTDGRARKWIWRNLGPNVPGYAGLWATLEGLDTRGRIEAGLSPAIEVWEALSGVGGFARLNGDGTRRYTSVRVVQAGRTPRDAGGPLSYETVLEFYVTDAGYTSF